MTIIYIRIGKRDIVQQMLLCVNWYKSTLLARYPLSVDKKKVNTKFINEKYIQ